MSYACMIKMMWLTHYATALIVAIISCTTLWTNDDVISLRQRCVTSHSPASCSQFASLVNHKRIMSNVRAFFYQTYVLRSCARRDVILKSSLLRLIRLSETLWHCSCHFTIENTSTPVWKRFTGFTWYFLIIFKTIVFVAESHLSLSSGKNDCTLE